MVTTAHWIVTDQRSWAELLMGLPGQEEGDFVSHDLELERTAPAWTLGCAVDARVTDRS